MKTKWFDLYKTGRMVSLRRAVTLKEAWEKTLEKWSLIIGGHRVFDDIATCGLCDFSPESSCNSCPIYKVTGRTTCEETPFIELCKHMDSERAGKTDKVINDLISIEYLFLLLVKEATEDGSM